MQTTATPLSKKDRRIRRTRRMILAGLIQLMQKKPVKDISVRELSDLVDINRSTFYLHYTDIYDLLEQSEEELMEQFLPIIRDHPVSATLQDFSKKLEQFFQVLSENQPFCKVLMSPNGDIMFVRKIEKLISDNGSKMLHTVADERHLEEEDLNYATSFFLSGCVGMVNRWIQNECQQTARQMADLAMKLLLSGLQGITKQSLMVL